MVEDRTGAGQTGSDRTGGSTLRRAVGGEEHLGPVGHGHVALDPNSDHDALRPPGRHGGDDGVVAVELGPDERASRPGPRAAVESESCSGRTSATTGPEGGSDPARVGTASARRACIDVGTDDLGVDQVRLAEEGGHVGIDRMVVERLGRPALTDASVPDDGDLVGHRQRLVLIVGHQHGRRARFLQHLLDVRPDRRTEAGVE